MFVIVLAVPVNHVREDTAVNRGWGFHRVKPVMFSFMTP